MMIPRYDMESRCSREGNPVRLSVIMVVAMLALAVDQSSFAQTPVLGWPLGPELGDGTFLLNYVDDEPQTGVQIDFTCRTQYLYDGHTGTDISANNFRLMDEGIPITAAADGEVVWVRNDEFDRNYWPPYQGMPNGIGIRHTGGIETQYWHNRTNSAAVAPGESVSRGQVIAMVGSSGQTPIPHVHFEVRDSGQYRNPFSGPCNTLPSMWDAVYPHPSDTTLRILDWDIFTRTALSGSESNNYFGETALKDRPFRPEVLGVDEPTMGIWVQLQGQPGAVYMLRIRAPDGSVRSEFVKGVSTSKSVQWHVHYQSFPVLSAGLEQITGLWGVELEVDGIVRHALDFEVGDGTEYGPRFYPLAGKSIRWVGSEVREDLTLSGREGPVVLRLSESESGVSIEGTQIVFSSDFEPPIRNTYVSVVAADSYGRADTMRFHIVDLSKPVGSAGASVKQEGAPMDYALGQPYPNPFSESISVPVNLKRSGDVLLSILDVRGRVVRRVPRRHFQSGRTVQLISGDGLPAGIYAVRLESRGRIEYRLITRLNAGH